MDIDLSILTRPQRNPHGTIDGHGQNKTVVVIGVLADQVDATRRAYDKGRRRAETGFEGLGDSGLQGHGDSLGEEQ